MKIAVIGAGAMGSIFGASFTEAGHDAVLVDVAEPLVAKINADGVIVARGDDEHTVKVPATANPAEVGEVDLAVFAVKCYHTQAAAQAAKPMVGSETVVASLQNGWGNGDVLEEVFGADNLVLGVTYNSGTVVDLGHVAHTGVGKTVIGAYKSNGDKAQPLEEALSSGGFEVEVSADVVTEIWKKLILNAATLPPAALTGLWISGLGEESPWLDLIDDLARETTAVARARGYDIDAEERVVTINNLLAGGGRGKGSMLQDFEANRKSEVDVITGAVVKAADEAGVDVPLNRAMLALVKGNERARGVD